MIYAEAYDNSCHSLKDLVKSGSFNPNQKQEIIEKLEFLINDYVLKNYKKKKISVKIQLYQKIPELNLYKIKKLKDFHKDERCLFTGLEIIKDVENKKVLLDGYCKFISKIYNEFTPNERRRLLIVDKTNTLTDKDIDFLNNQQKTDRVKIFLC